MMMKLVKVSNEWNWLVNWYKEPDDGNPKALHFTEGGPLGLKIAKLQSIVNYGLMKKMKCYLSFFCKLEHAKTAHYQKILCYQNQT